MLNLKVDLLNLENVKRAFVLANNELYTGDRTEYYLALFKICKSLNPELNDKEVGTRFLEL